MQSTIAIGRSVQVFAVPEVKPAPQSGARLIAICVAAILAMLVDISGANIINSALPFLQGTLAATPDQGSWIVTAFNAPYYATILFSPWLFARFSRKPLLIAALLGYAVTSLILAFVHVLSWEIVLRFVQGLVLGAVFVPAATLLFTSFPLSLLPLAPPIFAAIVLGGGLTGNAIGGFIAETYGGPPCYVPAALATLVAAALIYTSAPRVDTPQPRLRPDILGLILAVVMFGGMQYLANEGERRDWLGDTSVLYAATLVLIFAAAFILWELRSPYPATKLRLLSDKRNLLVGALINVVLGLVGYSVVLFVLYLETQINATETLAGLMILLRLVTYVLGITAAFALVRYHILSVRAVVCLSAIASALTLIAFGTNMTTTAQTGSFITLSLVFGLFFSMLSQPVPALVLGALGLEDLAHGLAIYKLSPSIGSMIGTGMFQTLLDHRSTLHITELGAAITRARLPIEQFIDHGGKADGLTRLVAVQAQSLAFQDAMIAFAAFTLLTIPIVLFADSGPAPKR